MERSSIIATVVAAGGILVAGSVASAAVINATSATQPEGSSTQIVADGAAAPSVVEPSPVSLPSEMATTEPIVLTDVSAEPLPEVVVPEVTIEAAPAAPAAQPQQAAKPAKTKAPKPAKTRTPSPSPTRTAEAVVEQVSEPEVRTIAVDKAVAMVLNATNGGVVQNAKKASHAGYDAWAVTVLRHDGSVITGFVDQVQGVVYDWAVVKEAPKPAPAAGGKGSSSNYDDDHDDDHDDDDHGDDHDGDDDDD